MANYHHSRFARSLLLGAAFVAFAQNPAAAQDAIAGEAEVDAAPESDLGVIIVTAQKRAENVQDTPIAITAIGSDRIEQGGLDNPGKLQFTVPSMTYGNVNGFAHITLRGVGNDTTLAAESSVATYHDGVYTGSQITAAIPTFDLERIEVLRGPQGTLYGRNTTGGVINYISKEPDFDFGVAANASYGNFNSVETNIGVTGPLIEDTLAVRASFHFDDRDGYYRNIAIDKREYAGRGIGGRLALLFRPSDNFTATIRGDIFDSKSSDAFALIQQSSLDGLTDQAHPLGIFSQPAAFFEAVPGLLSPADIAKLNGGSIADYYDLIQPGVMAPDPVETETFASWNTTSYEVESKGVSATLSWETGPVLIKSISGYRYGNLLNYADVGGQAYSVLWAGPITQRSDQYTQEFNISGEAFDDKLEWLLGAFGFSEKVAAGTGSYLSSFGQFLQANALLANAPGSEYAYNLDPASLGSLNDLPGVFPSVWQTVVQSGAGFPGDGAGANLIAGESIPETPFIGSRIDLKSTSVAGFAQATYNVTDRLRVTGGLRYTVDRKKAHRINRSNFLFALTANGLYQAVQAGVLPPEAYSEENIAAAAGLCDTKTRKTWKAWTGMIGVDYDATDDILVYAKASRGYKAGGMNNSECSRIFNPEYLTAYEGGVKALLADGQVLTNLAVYYYDYSDIQFTTYINNGSSVLNAGSAKSFGIELEYAFRPRFAPGFSLDGSASFQHSRYGTGCFGDAANINGAAFLSTPIQPCPASVVNPSTGVEVPIGPSADITGNQLIRAPKWKFNLGAQYEQDVSGLGNLMGRIDVAWTDTIYHDVFNGTAPFQSARTQPSYWMLNGQIGWTSEDERFSATLFGNNLTNTIHYAETVSFNLPPSVLMVAGQLAPPRTYGIRLSAKFGSGAY